MGEKGLIIVIEGTDASGKKTQIAHLRERLEKEHHTTGLLDFPRYENESSIFVRRFLAGEYGDATLLPPKLSSYFYALDRFDASKGIHQELAEGKILVSNRYTTSNIGHQGAKFSTNEERKEFFTWLDHFEFDELGIPRPDLVIFLDVPPAISLRLLEERAAKDNLKKDGLDEPEHLKAAHASYSLAAEILPGWCKVSCVSDNGQDIASIEDIHERIWEKVKEKLS